MRLLFLLLSGVEFLLYFTSVIFFVLILLSLIKNKIKKLFLIYLFLFFKGVSQLFYGFAFYLFYFSSNTALIYVLVCICLSMSNTLNQMPKVTTHFKGFWTFNCHLAFHLHFLNVFSFLVSYFLFAAEICL